jgi:hypothetical protein
MYGFVTPLESSRKNTVDGAIMKTLLVCIAVIIGQMNTLQTKQVAHLPPHRDTIQADFGGKLLELVNAPTIVHLPTTPPKLDPQGQPWSIDIGNLGPGATTVSGQLNSPYESGSIRLCM